jgi:hypothetical protein
MKRERSTKSPYDIYTAQGELTSSTDPAVSSNLKYVIFVKKDLSLSLLGKNATRYESLRYLQSV